MLIVQETRREMGEQIFKKSWSQNSRRQNGDASNHTGYSQILGATATGSRGLCTPAQCVYICRVILEKKNNRSLPVHLYK
jgi:hypothetical protein